MQRFPKERLKKNIETSLRNSGIIVNQVDVQKDPKGTDAPYLIIGLQRDQNRQTYFRIEYKKGDGKISVIDDKKATPAVIINYFMSNRGVTRALAEAMKIFDPQSIFTDYHAWMDRRNYNRIMGESKSINELKANSYFNASQKAEKLGQYNRAISLANGAQERFQEDNESNEMSITTNGFQISIPYSGIELRYDIKDDEMYYLSHSKNSWVGIKPGSQFLRTNDRKTIRLIINYFNEFCPNSKYNDKNLYIS